MESTCKYFLSKGFFVIRVGKIAEKKLELKHNKLIDYPFSSFQNDLLELYLMANCSFFIGNTSGPSMIPLIFRKPTLMTNYTEFSIFNKIKHNNFLMIFKLFF